MNPPSPPPSDGTPIAVPVEQMYAGAGQPKEAVDALLDGSLAPRGPDWLFEVVGSLGIGGGSRVLDVGCRDGRHLFELVRRFGCAGVGVEPVQANLRRGMRLRAEVSAAEPGVAARVTMVRGVAEALPFPDATFDLLWVRDALIHVADLVEVLAECRRVLAPAGSILIYQMFATPWLEPAEAARLWPPLAAVPENADPERFERAIAGAGLRVMEQSVIGSEWREFAEESGARTTSRQMLWAARLLRDRERLVAELGRVAYEVELANSLWGVYQMIGKLSPRIYVLAPA